MTGYQEVNLKQLIETVGEDRVKAILSDFSCPQNLDVEMFIRQKAITFAQQSVASTHLVFASYQSTPVFIGFYTIAIKQFTVKKSLLARRLRDRLKKFASYNSELDRYDIPAPLIGQLAKNFSHGYNSLITGDELLKMACDRVRIAQMIIGGKIVYLECENKPALIEFYKRNGFIAFSERPLDRDETSLMSGRTMIQMLRYFS